MLLTTISTSPKHFFDIFENCFLSVLPLSQYWADPITVPINEQSAYLAELSMMHAIQSKEYWI